MNNHQIYNLDFNKSTSGTSKISHFQGENAEDLRSSVHVREQLYCQCFTHNARPCQILIIVPLMSWSQVIETVKVLKESSKERDRTSLLHQTCINGEEEDDGHHQLRQKDSYK